MSVYFIKIKICNIFKASYLWYLQELNQIWMSKYLGGMFINNGNKNYTKVTLINFVITCHCLRKIM